ncbi:hypothetical protein DVA85_04200 [Acinetobacter sp. RIT592]|nr:hypothetical protein DVA85_04200 [Acinetobacter sp. RIT592]
MCDNLATTKEHVPPKCLFPEKKDLKDISLDLRKALIKVPSCVDHNCKKSGDDEYLFNVLSMTIQTGKYGLLNFESKVMRSWTRKDRISKLKEKLLSTARTVKIKDPESEDIFEALELTIDRDRLKEVLKCCALGLYYYEFGKKYKGSIHSTPLFSPILDKNWIEQQSQMEDYYSNKFKNIKRKGNNPEIFQYAFYQDTFNNMLVVQMWFYEECKVISFFR